MNLEFGMGRRGPNLSDYSMKMFMEEMLQEMVWEMVQ